MTANTILIVDDERALADTLSALLSHAGYSTSVVYSAADAIELLRTSSIDLLISDVVMPAMNGIELAMYTQRSCPKTQVLLISGNSTTQEILSEAHSQGHRFEVLAKPVFPKQMLERVEQALAASA